MGPASRGEASASCRTNRGRSAALVAKLGPERRLAGEAGPGYLGISGRRLTRLGCTRSSARGRPLAHLGVASRTRHTRRRPISAASHVGIPTTSSRTLTELERTNTGVTRHACAFVGRAGTLFTSAAGTPLTSAAASCCPRSSGMGSARRAG